MKRLGKCLLGLVFAVLLLLSCRTLVAHPQDEADAPLPLLPLQGVMRAATEASPAEDMLGQPLQETASRRLLPEVTKAAPLLPRPLVRDGNGIPLESRPYVRTVYTACRLEDTSG